MANSSTPFGFMPYGRVDGGAPTEELERVNINSSDTNAFFRGDLVARSSGALGNIIVNATTTLGSAVPPAGVFWGCKFFSAVSRKIEFSPNYPAGGVGSNAANGLTEAYIVSDPNVLFRAVGGAGDGGAGTTWATADIGLNTIVVTSQSSQGNAASGQSAMVLSSATTRNSSAPWKLFDLLLNRSIAGTPGTDAAAFNIVVVKPNNWERGPGQIAPST